MSNDKVSSSFGDMSFDDVATVAGFKTPPTGAYESLECWAELKKVGTNDAFVLNFKHSIDVPSDEPKDNVLVGDQFNTLFTEKGLGIAKGNGLLKDIFEVFGAQTLRGCVEAGHVTVNATIKRTVDSKDEDVFYANLKKISLA